LCLPPSPAQKCVRVAVVGAPNAGKSTLTNALVGRLVRARARGQQQSSCTVCARKRAAEWLSGVRMGNSPPRR
jgi:predicted GTPase